MEINSTSESESESESDSTVGEYDSTIEEVPSPDSGEHSTDHSADPSADFNLPLAVALKKQQKVKKGWVTAFQLGVVLRTRVPQSGKRPDLS